MKFLDNDQVSSIIDVVSTVGDEIKQAGEKVLSMVGGEPFAANIIDDGSKYQIEIALPGVSKEALEVSLAGDFLTVEVKASEEEDKREYLVREINKVSGKRSFELQNLSREDEASAELRDGILRLTLRKAVQPKTIEVF